MTATVPTVSALAPCPSVRLERGSGRSKPLAAFRGNLAADIQEQALKGFTKIEETVVRRVEIGLDLRLVEDFRAHPLAGLTRRHSRRTPFLDNFIAVKRENLLGDRLVRFRKRVERLIQSLLEVYGLRRAAETAPEETARYEKIDGDRYNRDQPQNPGATR